MGTRFKDVVRGGRGRLIARRLAVLLLFLSGWCVAGGDAQTPLRVLMLFDEGPDLVALDLIEEGFETTLLAGTTRPIEFYHEYLDASRFREAGHHKLFADYLRMKYGGMKLDLVVPVIGARMDWASRIPRDLFPDVPIVFGSCMSSGERSMPLVPEMTGVLFSIDVVKSLETALAVRPGARRVTVVAGPEGMYSELIARIEAAAESHPGIAFEYWTDRSAPEILESAASLPHDSLVFYLELFRDSEGASFIPWQFGRSLAKAASVPVFGIYESYLDTGIVGGAVVSFSLLGVETGKRGLRVLNGERASAIPVVNVPGVISIFDWRAMDRWGIDTAHLPPGSIVRFPPPSLWASYRKTLIAGGIFIIVLMLLMAGLLLQQTGRRRAERKLREHENRLKLAVDVSGAGLWSLELGTNTFWMTNQTRSMFGFLPEEEISLARLLEVVHPDDCELLQTVIDETVASGESGRVEYRVIRPDGAVRWIVSRGRTHVQPGGSPSRLMGVSLDITEAQAKSEVIRKQRDFVETLINGLPGIYYLYDQEWRLIRWNVNHQTVTGFSREEMFKRHVLDWFSPPHKEVVERAVRRVFEEGEATVDAPLLMKDGSEVPYVFNGVRLEIQGESYFLGMGIDISQRVGKETALRRSEKQLRLIADSLPALIAHVDSEQRYRFVNQSYADRLGLACEEIQGKHLREVLGDNAYGQIAHRVETVLSGQPVTFESVIQVSASSPRHLMSMYQPEFDGSTVCGFFASIHDVTDIEAAKADARHAQDTLAHVSRVSTMSELATSLAHELNQPLSAILSNAQAGLRFLRQEDSDLKEIQELLADIVADDKRAADVIQRMRDFLRKDRPQRELLDVNGIVREVLMILHSEMIIRGMFVRTDLSKNLPRVHGDRIQLQQVLVNLVVNAEEAMKSAGVKSGALVIRTSKTPDGRVLVCVQDTGPGIPEEMLERVFDPFYTTKNAGIGMGLAISRTIVEMNDGRIWAENVLAGGARLYVSLLPEHHI